MDKQKFHGLLIALSLIASLESRADETALNDMCPGLPDEVASMEPKYKDYVLVKSSEKEWNEQYEKYTQAKNEFESKYRAELEKVESEWVRLEEKQFPSQTRFYDLLAEDSKNEGLLNDVKSACWGEVMGINEFEKDNLCNPLEKSPSSTEWNKILVCTMERAGLLKIRFYQ